MSKPMWTVSTDAHLEYEVIIEPDGNGYHAYVPSLIDLHVGGETHGDALINVRDAVIAYVRSLIKHGDSIPTEAHE